jgi:hypothetical protein
MKKYIYSLMAILLALFTVGFAACSDDDEPKAADIVGTWQYNHTDDDEWSDEWDIYYQFTKEGKFHIVEKSHVEYYYGHPSVIVHHGTYTVSGKKLIVTYDFDPNSDYTEPSGCEYSVQGDKLKLLGGEYPTFIRVEDSVIEPYLNIVPHPC